MSFLPDPARLRSTVEALSALPTRNTLSDGCAQAAEWIAAQLAQIPGIEVETMRYVMPKGRRVPEPRFAPNVIGTLPGRTGRRIVLSAHFDSLNLRVQPHEPGAPGANDDASGVAAVLEVARLLATIQPECTIHFALLSGEEQGLLGAHALAQCAQQEHWNLEAVLNNDTIGSSGNLLGLSEPTAIRVFSEESPRHNARELARWMEWQTREHLSNFRVKLVLRRDRFGRGGDHTPFTMRGFSAVRLTEVHEEYSRQHTPDDLIKHMDFDYLAHVTEINALCAASLAQAEPAPRFVRIVRDQSHSTTLRWQGTPGQKYAIYWRDTASAAWQDCREITPEGDALTLQTTIDRINKDDHFFAVSSLGGIPQPAQ